MRAVIPCTGGVMAMEDVALLTDLILLGFLGSFGEGCGILHFQEPSPEFLLKVKNILSKGIVLFLFPFC